MLPPLIRKLSQYLLLSVTLSLFAGCGLFSKDEPEEEAQSLYKTARKSMRENRNQDAIEQFKKLEINHPFSTYTQEAPLSLAYLHYQNRSYEKAEVSIDQFIRLNPDNPNLDYAYYLRGMIHYNYSQGFLSKIIKTDITTKNPEHMVEAFNSFKLISEQYPDSKYVTEAKRRTVTLRNLLAVYELRIADYYIQRGVYAAAINRIKYLLEHYQGAQHIPEALALLADAYRRMGLLDLSKDTLKVLKLNYPDYYQNKVVNN